MREIKFKAWERYLEEVIPVDNIDFESRMINTDSAWRTFDEIELIERTDILDQDGLFFYEGDIVESTGKTIIGLEHTHVGEVLKGKDGRWLVCGWIKYLNGGKSRFETSLYENKGEFKTIGNVYENWDLLK